MNAAYLSQNLERSVLEGTNARITNPRTINLETTNHRKNSRMNTAYLSCSSADKIGRPPAIL